MSYFLYSVSDCREQTAIMPKCHQQLHNVLSQSLLNTHIEKKLVFERLHTTLEYFCFFFREIDWFSMI